MATKKKLLSLKPRKFLPNYTFGVEIECYGVHPDAIALALHYSGIKVAGYELSGGILKFIDGKKKANNRIHWDIGNDSSVEPEYDDTYSYDDREGLEIRSPILRGKKGLEELAAVCKILEELGLKTNDSCGLHVHVGIRNSKKRFTVEQAARIVSSYQDSLDTISKWLKADRRCPANFDDDNSFDVDRSTNEFCQPMNRGQLREAREKPSLQQFSRNFNHYHMVSFSPYRKYGTVEFRQHHGTVSPKEIVSWVKFLLNHVENARQDQKLTLLAGVDSAVARQFNKQVKSYQNSRPQYW